eukprot:SAG31_NODE_24420_length_481_cov_1.413613_2_plen_50_part_01
MIAFGTAHYGTDCAQVIGVYGDGARARPHGALLTSRPALRALECRSGMLR